MRLIRRIAFLCCLFMAFQTVADGQCVSVDAGPDLTVCTGQCATLHADVIGTQQTNVYLTASIPYTPYPFTGGTPVLVNLDDLWSPLVNIPFCFDFYGTVYNQLVIGTNGVITFNASQANGTCPWTINVSAPNAGLPLNSIMAPFQDIDPTFHTAQGATSINWNVYGTAPCRSFVVNWNDVAMYGNNCDSLTATSQVVLHESTNIIDIFIQNKSSCPSWNNGAAIEGLQNATGTAAITYPGRNYPGMWNAVNDGVRFTPAGLPNYTIQWFDASNNVVGNGVNFQACPTQTTTYTVQVVNNSCSAPPQIVTDTVTLFYVNSVVSATDTLNYPTCNGNCDGNIGIIVTSGQAPYTYTWTPLVSNGPVATNLCAGSYICLVTDATGCNVVVSVNLVPPPPFMLSAASTPTICNDSTGTATLTIAGGIGPFTMEWSTGDTTAFIDTLHAGSYQVVVTDSAGCKDSIIAVVSQSGLLLTMQSTPLLCNGDCNATATVTPTNGIGPFTYNWVPYGGSSATATSLCSGIFACNVTDSVGCTASIAIPISSPQPIVVTPAANQTICLGQSAQIGAIVTGGTPPYTYTWNNNLPSLPSHTIVPAQTTIYSVIVTDANGCTSVQQSTLVKVNHAPQAGFSATRPVCPPVMVNFTNLTDTAVSYYWNFGDPSSGANDTSTLISPSHVYNTGGNYTVTLIATNAYGCADTVILPNAAPVPEAAVASASASSFLTTLDPVMVLNNTSSHAVTYLVVFGDGDSLFTTSPGPYAHAYDTLGTFTITLYAWSADGCPDTTWLTVTIEEATTLFLPNAFTPNGDGNNDHFMVYGNNVKKMHLMIFDRWGLLIFESRDINNGWDGTCKGDRVQQDVYVWKLLYEDNFSGMHELIGNVSVVR